MAKSLPQACYAILSKDIKLDRVSGLDDLEAVKLLNGENGGGIKIYSGDNRIRRVVMVDFTLGPDGVPVPHHENRPCVETEIFQIAPDLSYRLPLWGINSVIMKDGTYYFDTDFTFGLDLVQQYDFVMKYFEPFNEIYKKYSSHPDLKVIPLADMTTWVRTYISPAFITAITTVDKVGTVHALAADYIKLWLQMYNDAVEPDAELKQLQEKRVAAQYAGMKNTDRMGKVLLGAFGKETFGRFFKAMTA